MSLSVLSFPMVAVMAAAALVVVAGGAASPAPIGKRGCETRCGDVSVPYPFGFGQDRCSVAPGFKLNCVHDNTTDMSSGAGTRLLLGDHGDFEVKEISVKNRTIRGLSRPIFINATINNTGHSTVRSMGFEDNRWQYSLPPTSTELVVTGYNVQVTLLFTSRTSTYGYTTGCCSHCNSSGVLTADDVRYNYMVGFCKTPVFSYLASYTVELKRLVGNSTINDNLPVYAFIAEESWFDSDRAVGLMNLGAERSVSRSKANKDDHLLAPLVLDWECPNDGTCNASVSANANCSTPFEGAQYVCHCNPGYKGNPYLTDGCQNIDECEQPKDHGCFGECRNTHGSFDCWCARGLQGNDSEPNGCHKITSNRGLVIGLSVAIGPSLILFFLSGLLIARKLKHHRAEKLKQKFFNQNHGQLLQQLVSQRSDIGERMIIPLKEIEKATNNFDKTRKLGGGGHGTVYKGILSDLHVVAIKKSTIMVQRLSVKSDVYSFGILLVELLTRRMPIMYRTSEGDGLVAQFVELLEEGKLVVILDFQVVEEGGSEIEEVAALAASCIKLRAEERPTMRQVDMALEGIQANKQLVLHDLTGEQNEENDSMSTSFSL